MDFACFWFVRWKKEKESEAVRTYFGQDQTFKNNKYVSSIGRKKEQ